MRHGKTFNHLGRTASHRRALLSNMASSLILHKRISTTVAKAKALRKYVEPIITKSKSDSTHNRRVVFSYLQDKESVKILFDEISEKVNDRPGGYTRIIKMGNRLGDNAEMCMMELVDYNELLLEDKAPAKAKTRRSRRGKKKSADAEVEATPVAETSVVEEAEVIEEPAAEVVEEVKAEEVVQEVKAEEVVQEVKAEEVESATEETKEDSGDKSEPETDSEEDSKKE